MTFDDIIIGGVCLAVGYWLVSWIIEKFQGRSKPGNTSELEKGSIAPDSSAARIESLDNTWYRILGVSSIATVSEIKAAYKAAVNKYHPDNVAALGEEFRELADNRTKEIDAAYQYAVNKYGAQFFK